MPSDKSSLQTMTHHDDHNDNHNVRSALVPTHDDGSEAKCCKCRFPHINLLPHGSMAASGFNLASATLGAGTLAIPQAMAYCGSLVGSLLLVLCCAGTIYSIRLLIIVLEKTGFSTYEEMSHKLVHPIFEKVTAALIIVFCWGITIVYVVAMGDILDPLRQISGFPEALEGTWGRRAIMTIFWALFMLPLSLAKEINTLRYASLIGMASTGFLVAAIVTHTSIDAPPMENLTIARFDVNMIMSMSVFIFAYCCQTNCFEIYAEMTNRSVNKMTLTTAVAMTTCTIIYIIAGIAGAADFGQDTDGNILKNYKNPTETLYIAVAFVAISITLTMAFPICIFPTRDAILQMLGYKDAYSTPSHVRLLCAGVLATTAITVGLFVPGIQILFGVLGGVCGSTLAFIWPALFILRTGEWTRETAGLGNMIATYALLILGFQASIKSDVEFDETILSRVEMLLGAIRVKHEDSEVFICRLQNVCNALRTSRQSSRSLSALSADDCGRPLDSLRMISFSRAHHPGRMAMDDFLLFIGFFKPIHLGAVAVNGGVTI